MSPIAVSVGDPAGVGPEIITKAWEARSAKELNPFFVIGSISALRSIWAGPIVRIQDTREVANAFNQGLPLLEIGIDEDIFIPSSPDIKGAELSFDALKTGIDYVQSGRASALVTAPVSKTQLAKIGFQYPGQTEYIAETVGVYSRDVVMMLAGPSLKVALATIHIPLSSVSASLTQELIMNRVKVTVQALQSDFGIPNPRIAIAGLNPHASENGAFGDEENKVILPAVQRLQHEGFNVFGPVVPDAMFTPRSRQTYDVAFCMYHDQGLIPLKALDFDQGVNMTLGLPIVRTSPDHGTAFDIAGKNIANPGAMIAALRMASDSADHRKKTQNA